MEICTGITATLDHFKNPILLRVHNGILTAAKSILSVNCMRNAQVRVDDCPCRFGGNQAMWLPNEQYLPFLYKRGLTYLPIQKPTEEEVANLTIHDITRDDWDPDDQCDTVWTFEYDDIFEEDDPNN